MSTTLFHHPGTGDDPWPADRLLETFRRAGVEPRYCSTAEEGWEEVLRDTHDLAIVAGGDGTVARVATALPDRRVPIFLVPMGSANNVSRSLGAFGEIEDLVRGLAGAREVPMSIGELRGRWGVRRFVESIGIGALARSTAELQDADLDGADKHESGRAALARTIARAKPVRAMICPDDGWLDEPALLVEVMNTCTIGPILQLGPDFAASDGKLSLIWLPERRRADMVEWLAGPDDGWPPLEHRSADRVSLDATDEPLRIDDKTVEWDGSRVEMRLEPEALRIMVPEGAGRG